MTGLEQLVGSAVDLSASRGGRTDLLQGVTLAAVGAAGVLVTAGGRGLFVPWPAVQWVARAAKGGSRAEEPAPTPEDLASLWGDDVAG